MPPTHRYLPKFEAERINFNNLGDASSTILDMKAKIYEKTLEDWLSSTKLKAIAIMLGSTPDAT